VTKASVFYYLIVSMHASALVLPTSYE